MTSNIDMALIMLKLCDCLDTMTENNGKNNASILQFLNLIGIPNNLSTYSGILTVPQFKTKNNMIAHTNKTKKDGIDRAKELAAVFSIAARHAAYKVNWEKTTHTEKEDKDENDAETSVPPPTCQIH